MPDLTRTRFAACAIALVTLGASAGCAPVLTKRYQVLSGSLGDGKVTLEASAFPIDPPGPKTVFDLAGEGQAAAVTAYGSKAENISALQAAIAGPLTRQSGSGILDASTVSRRVVLSLGTVHQSLADRLDACTMTLHFDASGPAKFKSWNQLSTRFETIDLGKLTFSQKGTLSAGLEGNAPGAGEIDKATLGASLENAMAEEVQLRRRYVASSGVLTDTDAKVIQQGAVGIDLVGNTVIDITITARSTDIAILYRPESLFGADGAPRPPGDVQLTRRLVRYPTTIAGGWSAALTGSYFRRRVTVGAETLTESDDEVEYREESMSGKAVTLATEDELRVSKWLVMAGQNVLSIQEPDGPATLQFDSYDGARDFLIWLKATNATSVNGRMLGVPALGAPALSAITAEQRAILRVEISGVNWKLPVTPPTPH